MTAQPLWTLDAMAQAMRAERTGALPVSVNGISIDSRSVGARDAFFAIKGDNRDGHEFVTAALKGGAGAPQVIAYTTAWSLYTIQRLFNWEIHMMSPKVVWLRAMVSFPLPFLAGIGAMLIGKP